MEHYPSFTGNNTTKCNYLVDETLIKSRVGKILLTLRVRTFPRLFTIFSFELEVPTDTTGFRGRFPDVGLLPNWYFFLHGNSQILRQSSLEVTVGVALATKNGQINNVN